MMDDVWMEGWVDRWMMISVVGGRGWMGRRMSDVVPYHQFGTWFVHVRIRTFNSTLILSPVDFSETGCSSLRTISGIYTLAPARLWASGSVTMWDEKVQPLFIFPGVIVLMAALDLPPSRGAWG